MFVFVFVYINTRGSCKTSTSHTGTIESARGSSTGGSIEYSYRYSYSSTILPRTTYALARLTRQWAHTHTHTHTAIVLYSFLCPTYFSTHSAHVEYASYLGTLLHAYLTNPARITLGSLYLAPCICLHNTTHTCIAHGPFHYYSPHRQIQIPGQGAKEPPLGFECWSG